MIYVEWTFAVVNVLLVTSMILKRIELHRTLKKVRGMQKDYLSLVEIISEHQRFTPELAEKLEPRLISILDAYRSEELKPYCIPPARPTDWVCVSCGERGYRGEGGRAPAHQCLE